MNATRVASDRSLLRRLRPQTLKFLPPQAEADPRDRASDAAIIDRIQQLRGAVFLADGAIPASGLDDQGRHRSDVDPLCWHVYTEDAGGRITGCLRALKHDPGGGLDDLTFARYLRGLAPDRAREYYGALERRLRESADRGVPFFEVGGWAVVDFPRTYANSVILPLACWSLGQLLGGAIGVSLSTQRHNVVAMLLRLGGFPLEEESRALEPFFSAYHGNHVQLLGFDSHRTTYGRIVDEISEYFLGLDRWRWPDGRRHEAGSRRLREPTPRGSAVDEASAR